VPLTSILIIQYMQTQPYTGTTADNQLAPRQKSYPLTASSECVKSRVHSKLKG